MLVFLSAACFLTGCGGGSGGVSSKNKDLQTFTEDFQNFSTAGGEMTQSIYSAIQIQTQNFTYPVKSAPALNAADLKKFDDALFSAYSPSVEVVQQGVKFLDILKSDGNPIITKSFALTYYDRDTGRYEQMGQKEGKLLFAVFILAGVALAGYEAYQGVAKAVDQRAEPAKKAIQNATGDELKEMNKSMGLPETTSNADTLKHFNNLGINAKNSTLKKIEEINADPDIGSHSATSDIPKAVSNAAVTVGETGVKTYVNAMTTATGGQGYSKLAQAAGATETTGEMIDLGISAIQTATGKPLQPLDVFADKCLVVTAKKDKKDLQIPPPTQSMTKENAAQVISDVSTGKNLDTITTDDIKSATSVLSQDLVNSQSKELQPKSNTDGSVTVQVPGQIYITEIDKPKNGDKIQVPNMGKSDVIIIAEGKVPQIIEDVDTAEKPVVGVEDTDLEDYDPEALEGKHSLYVSASPSDPGPGQGVTVTGRVSPAEAGVKMRLSISGTDGYTNSKDAETDSSGKATLYIPGGAE